MPIRSRAFGICSSVLHTANQIRPRGAARRYASTASRGPCRDRTESALQLGHHLSAHHGRYDDDSADLGAEVVRDICKREKVQPQQVVLHSDNGSPMKGTIMLATLPRLGVMPSFSRPGVSNDNPSSESLFKTLKYRPGYPSQAFADLVVPGNGWQPSSTGTTRSTCTALSGSSHQRSNMQAGTNRY
jgi:transposase InsO family protein